MSTIQQHSTPIRSWSHIQSVIRDVNDIERTWQAVRPNGDARITPFMPFPLYDFIALVAEALVEAKGGKFLDIGCGPGSKMLLASSLFGLDVRGFDINSPMVEYARSLGLNAEQTDAVDFDSYQDADLVWFNRVFRDRKAQSNLEEKVWPKIAPGAIVICANLEWQPPSSWGLILDDMEIRREIRQKPLPAPGPRTI